MWRLIAELLAVAPTAKVREHVDEIDGAVVVVSDDAWGACRVRFDSRGIELIAPVLFERWSWSRYRREVTAARFADMLLRSLGGSSTKARRRTASMMAEVMAGLLALGTAAREQWFIRALVPQGLDAAGSSVDLVQFPGLVEEVLSGFEAAAAAAARYRSSQEAWVLYRDLTPVAVLTTSGGVHTRSASRRLGDLSGEAEEGAVVVAARVALML